MELPKGALITQDRQKISYEHALDNHDRIVAIAHGFYNSKDAVLLQELKNRLLDGYDVFMFDFRVHGKSDGLFSRISNKDKDLKAALDYIERKYKKTGMIAFPLGASVAINVLAQDKRIDSLICVSAASDPDKIDYNFWNLDLKDDLAYTLFTPVCYIHGEKDWVIKPRHSKILFEKTQTKKKIIIIKNGSHAEYLMEDSRSEFVKEILDWFNLTL